MSSSNPSDLSPKSAEHYKHFMTEGKELAASGLLFEALEALKKACEICSTDRVLSRIKKLEEFIKENAENVENNEGEEMIEVAPGFFLYHEIYEKLFSYQRTGVAWMHGLFKRKKGGVLGDDMGLGKTFQIIAFLSGMIDANLIKSILIIMPVSLLPNWKKEFADKCPGVIVCDFHGTSKKQREQNVIRVQRRGGVLLTSYGMVVSNVGVLDSIEGRSFIWDYVILDEGHKIKNPTKTTKAVHEIPARNRLVLTGTPLQNNLSELWALYDFTHYGTLLGSRKTFKMQYETPITRSREKDSTLGERKLGTEMSGSLKQLISPYFLRRTKEEVFKMQNYGQGDENDVDELNEQFKDMKLSMKTRKNDFIIWLFLSSTQHEIYTSFLQSDSVKQILVTKRSPLVELTVLKKICDHPRLLSIKACMQLGLNGEMSQEQLFREIEDERTAAASIKNVSDDVLINESGKMKFTIELLEHLKATGHRTLVFSLSRKILDMIERILTQRHWKILRIDGTVSKMEERQNRIDLFQSNSSYPVFLLTTQVGGVGLTLTAADRVIIYDPSWNPATDAQAVDRVYRIGQTNNVVVYRLITCGTVEEKIYRNQIFKDSITRQTTSQAKDPHRYFSKQELRELFAIEDIYHSKTQEQLARMHSNDRMTDISLDEHIAYIHNLNIFGISDHNLMFSKEVKESTTEIDEASVSNDYIKRRVEMAQMMVRTESSVVEEGMRQTGTFVKPFTLPIPSAKKTVQSDGFKQPQFPETIDLTQPKFSPDTNLMPRSANACAPEVITLSPPSAIKHSRYPSPTAEALISSLETGDSPNSKTHSPSRSPRWKADAKRKYRNSFANQTGSPPTPNLKIGPYLSGTPKRESDIREMQSYESPRNSFSRVSNAFSPKLKIGSLTARSPKREPDVVNINILKNSSRNSSSRATNSSFSLETTSRKEKSDINSKSIFAKPNFVSAGSPKSNSGDKVSSSSPRSSFAKVQDIDSPVLYSPISNFEARCSKSNNSTNLSLSSEESLVVSEGNQPVSKPTSALKKTRLFDDTLGSLDFSDQERFSVNKRLSKRKSCVNRRSTMVWSESDSNKSACVSTNTSTEFVVADSDPGLDSDASDNSSPSVIEDSPHSSLVKQADKGLVSNVAISITKNASNSAKNCASPAFKFQVKSVKNAVNGDITYQNKFDSPKRITPIRIDPTRPSPSNAAFEKAIVASKELSPLNENTMKTSKSKTQQHIYLKNNSLQNDNDSPIAVSMKKKAAKKIITSDTSDDDDGDSHLNQKIPMTEKSKVYQKRSKGSGNNLALDETLPKLNLTKSLSKTSTSPPKRDKNAVIKSVNLTKQRKRIETESSNSYSDSCKSDELNASEYASEKSNENESVLESNDDLSKEKLSARKHTSRKEAKKKSALASDDEVDLNDVGSNEESDKDLSDKESDENLSDKESDENLSDSEYDLTGDESDFDEDRSKLSVKKTKRYNKNVDESSLQKESEETFSQNSVEDEESEGSEDGLVPSVEY